MTAVVFIKTNIQSKIMTTTTIMGSLRVNLIEGKSHCGSCLGDVSHATFKRQSIPLLEGTKNGFSPHSSSLLQKITLLP